MKTVDILKGTRELLSDPAKWTKGEYALDADGLHAEPEADAACCWCIKGAAIKVSDGDWNADLLIDEAIALCVPENFRGKYFDGGQYALSAAFNDSPSTTHADVLAVLDCAIAKADA